MIEDNKQINAPNYIDNNENNKECNVIIEKSKLDKIIQVFSDIKDEICSWNWSEILCNTFQIIVIAALILSPIIIIALAISGIIHPVFFIPAVIGLGIELFIGNAMSGNGPGGYLTDEQQILQSYIS
ncbi:MAG: hypothetical protein H0T62_03575 [Parachlamydiaceae bacterium]|nr:hypothetical protein [Parachlamydiaceae bacterium]